MWISPDSVMLLVVNYLSYFWYWCLSGASFALHAHSSVSMTYWLSWEPLVHITHWHFTHIFQLKFVRIQARDEKCCLWLTIFIVVDTAFGELTFLGSSTAFAIFSMSSLHLPLLFISLLLLLLSPPFLKESISAPQLTVLFLVLCATCRLKTQLQLLVHQKILHTQYSTQCPSICNCARRWTHRSDYVVLCDPGDKGRKAEIWVECAGCWLKPFWKRETRQEEVELLRS